MPTIEEISTQVAHYFSSGEYEACIEYCTQILQRVNRESLDDEGKLCVALILCKRAECFLQLHKLQDALADANESIQIKPSFIEAYEKKGLALYALNNFEDALIAFQQGLARDPDNENFPEWISMCNDILTEDDSMQVEELQQTTQQQAESFKEQGNQEFAKQDYAKAIGYYSQAILLEPNNAIYFNNRATAHAKLNDFVNSLSDAERALKLNPTFIKAWYRKGMAHMKLQQYDLALSAFQHGVQLETAVASNNSKSNNSEMTQGMIEAELAVALSRNLLPPQQVAKIQQHFGNAIMGQTLHTNLQIMASEAFGREVCSMNVKIASGTIIRCLRTIVIDKECNIVRTDVPFHMGLKERDRDDIKRLSQGQAFLASLFVHVHVTPEADGTHRQEYFFYAGESTKVKHQPISEAQLFLLQFIGAQASFRRHLNPFMDKILFP